MTKPLLASLLILTLITPTVSAHQLKTDHEVGALMHIEPTDNPQAMVPTTVWFALVKKGGQKIPLAHCACTLTLENGPQKIQTLPLSAPTRGEAKDSPAAQVTFPTPGTYLLTLAGKPQGSKVKYLAFTLRWQVKVSR